MDLLVFKMSEDPEAGPIAIRVYSLEGRFVCETSIDRGGFELTIDRRFRRLNFTERGLFGILPLRGDELETPRLFRVGLRP